MHKQVLCLLVVATAACVEPVPRWHTPCGLRRAHGHKTATNTHLRITWRRQLQISVNKVKKQLNIAIRHYKQQNFSSHYSEARIGVDEHQLVPGKGDVKLLLESRPIVRTSQVGSKLPKLHRHLQKFAVVIERMIQDETDNIEKHRALQNTETNLIQLLCEVETALLILDISVPAPIPRSLLSTLDTTHRLVRDWSTLVKYRDYIEGWARILRTVSRINRTNKQRSTNRFRCNKLRNAPCLCS